MDTKPTHHEGLDSHSARTQQPERKTNRPKPGPTSEFLTNLVFRFIRLGLPIILLAGVGIAQARDLPYKGRAEGKVLQSIFIAEPQVGGGPFLWERATAVGNFTHVGRTEIVLEWVVCLGVVDETICFFTEGTFSMTTANGDTINGTFVSRQNLSASESEILVTVKGGTGLFAGASGVIPGVGIKFDGGFSYSLDGQIAF